MTFRNAAVAAAILALAAPCYAQDTVEFKSRTPVVGETRTDTRSTKTEQKLSVVVNNMPPRDMDQKQSEASKTTIEVLEAEGNVIKKVRLSVESSKMSMTTPMGDQSREGPLVGKSVTVTYKDGGDNEVALEGEGSLTDEEKEFAREQTDDSLGEFKNKFGELIPDRAIKVGETLEITPEKARKAFDFKDEGPDVKKMTLTLKGTKDHNGAKVAIFDVVFDLGGEPRPGVNIEINLTGEMLVGVDSSWPHKVDLKGPIKIDGKQQQGEMNITMTGKGEMGMNMDSAYSTAGAAAAPAEPKGEEGEKKDDESKERTPF